MPRWLYDSPRSVRRVERGARPRRGLTLIELLVIIVILALITSAAIPVMVISQQGRRQRDAARMLTSFLNGARSRAIATGRPVGVVLEHENKTEQKTARDPVITTATIPDFVTRLSYTEMPPPWSGDMVDSTVAIVRAKLCAQNALDERAWSCAVIPPWGFDQQDLTWRGQIRQGDRIRFNYEGKWYRLYAGDPWIDSNGDGIYQAGEPYLDWDYDGRCSHETLGLLLKDGYFHNKMFPSFPGPLPSPPQKSPIYTYLGTDEPFDPVNGSMPSQVRFDPPSTSASGLFPYVLLSKNFEDTDGAPASRPRHPKFQIERQPTRSASDMLQLPEGAGVDLYWSGMKSDTAFFGDSGAGDGLAPEQLGPMRPMILFGPSGRVESIYNGAAGFRPTGSVFLLVGRSEGRMSILADPASPIPLVTLRNYGLPVKPPAQFVSNILDARSLWVSVSPQNGLVTTAENFVEGSVGVGPSGTLTTGDVVALRRTFVKTGRSISGK